MKTKEPVFVLISDKISVRFPLVSSASRWRILFGKKIKEWHYALREVSLSVPKGKMIGVIGRNGAGKSTLLRALAGVYPLSNGSIVRLGPISSLFELGDMGGGVLITGKQYVKRWLRLNNVARSEWQRLLLEVREFSELGDRFDDGIFTYSSGMAARLFFSTATCIGHKIYLIDEALSVGDEHFQAKCWSRVRERMSNGVSGVLVSHDWSAILRLCGYSYELQNGQIAAEGNSEQIICDYLALSDQLEPNPPAHFSKICPVSFKATCNEAWTCDIPVDVTGNEPVFFNYSVEILSPGSNWQILFIGSDTLIASSVGKYLVRIEITTLPLPKGEYHLNLFLTGASPVGGGPKPDFDIRSWTTGNSLTLSVDGPEQTGLVTLPLLVDHV